MYIIYISIARNVHEIELAVPEQPEPLNLMGTFMKLPDSGSRRSLGWSSRHSCSARHRYSCSTHIVPVLTLLQCQSQHSCSVEVLTLLQCQHSCSVEVLALLQCRHCCSVLGAVRNSAAGAHRWCGWQPGWRPVQGKHEEGKLKHVALLQCWVLWQNPVSHV